MEDFEKALDDAGAAVVQSQDGAEAGSEQPVHNAGERKVGAVATPKQTAEDNSKFADMRRATERLQKELDAKAAEVENYRLAFEAAKESDGWRGSDPLAFADEKISERTGRTPEEVRAERLAKQDQESKLRAFEKTSDEMGTLRQELVFQKDLLALKDAFPNEKFSSVKDLGDTFIGLRAAGVDAVTAYNFVQGGEAGKKGELPDIGSVSKGTGSDAEYFSSTQLDKLTSRQLDDPKIFEKALKSLERIGKLKK